jgi:hypothetical protein
MKHRHPGTVRYRTKKGKIRHRKRPIHKFKIVRKGGYLNKSNRDTFQRLDKKKNEHGGYMDFNEKGLERADVYIGREGSVDFDITPDKEVEYHTHPKHPDKRLNKMFSFPSRTDIRAFDDCPTQSMLVFHDNKLMMATKRDDFKPDEKIMKKIYSGINKDSYKMGLKKLFEKYKPMYGELGLNLSLIKPDTAVKVPIDAIEPLDKPMTSKRGLFFDDEPSESFEEQLERYSQEKEDRMNDPRFADKEEVELLFQEQIQDLSERS